MGCLEAVFFGVNYATKNFLKFKSTKFLEGKKLYLTTDN